MGTFDSVYTNRIKKLQEENLRLKRFILEANVEGGMSAPDPEQQRIAQILSASDYGDHHRAGRQELYDHMTEGPEETAVALASHPDFGQHEHHFLAALRSPHFRVGYAAFDRKGMREKFNSIKFGKHVKGKGAHSFYELHAPVMADNEYAASVAVDHPQYGNTGDESWDDHHIAAAISSPFQSVRKQGFEKFGWKITPKHLTMAMDAQEQRKGLREIREKAKARREPKK